ncbi:uncharacterized protein LOC125777392 [Bactrocera dorsalis]|uniref:Uncharacterized protein LOC125777392 n=1 Tax=Bactrocera dorsalis TaxID=27457 RepID=A0ABM3JFV3_BACDO|nr:uncharacterized protein LOC125777392 [Bactrocera dorsalis]
MFCWLSGLCRAIQSVVDYRLCCVHGAAENECRESLKWLLCAYSVALKYPASDLRYVLMNQMMDDSIATSHASEVRTLFTMTISTYQPSNRVNYGIRTLPKTFYQFHLPFVNSLQRNMNSSRMFMPTLAKLS